MGKGSTYSGTARHEAQQILAHAPFRVGPRKAPAPLAGLLNAIGRGLRDVLGKPLAWAWDHTIGALHVALGGWAWLLLGALALALGGIVGVLLLRRRGSVTHDPEVPAVAATLPNAQALEQAADEAESRGANGLAVRLRFEAGLARLEARGIIASRLTMTTDRLRGRLGSPVFEGLADRHEAITYAHDAASEDDVEAARSGWPQVLAEAETAGTERTEQH